MLDIVSIFQEVEDPREDNSRHELSAILFIALIATLCGARNFVEIADFAAANEDELCELVDLAHGAPSHDTFTRLFRLLDPEELARAFAAFLALLRRALGLRPAKGQVAIDGKALRGAYERGKAAMPAMLVSVWDCETRLAIASARAPGGNEVAAALDLLKSLILKGCTVTADALHCHATMAAAIVTAKADYVLTLKGNQSALHAAVQAAFVAAGAAHEEVLCETGHDRVERRCGLVLPAGDLGERHGFPKLAAIGRVRDERTLNGKTSTRTRYFLLSRKLSSARLMKTVRSHWSIENQLHWVLDVVFREDDARTRKDYAPENLAVIRRFAHNILRSHPSPISMRRKMNLARWKDDFFYELFTHMR